MGNDTEVNGCGLIGDTIAAFAGRTVEKEKSFEPRPEVRMPQIRTNILLKNARILVKTKKVVPVIS